MADTDGNKRHYKANTVLIVAGISWGAISFAYAGSVIGTTLGQPSFYKYMGLDTNPHEQGLIGTITGLFYAGGCFGCFLNAYLADKIGRKLTVVVASIISIISMACLAGSVNIGMFIAFRFFAGAGEYMLYLSAPLWVTELVPPKGRSILAGIPGLFGVVGYIAAAWIGVGFYYYRTTDSAQWRAPIAIGCFPPLCLLACTPWLPESPRWLLSQEKEDHAWEIVKKMHTSDDDPDHEYAVAEFFQMKQQNRLDRSLDASWKILFTRPSYRKRALIAFGLPVILYSTGNLVITTYAATIFSGIGYDTGQSLMLLAGTYVAAIAGNLISLTYVDRIPRHIILSIGVIGVTVVLSIETALLANFLGTTNTNGLGAAAGFIFLFLFTFNLFLEGPSWYYASEIFPTHLRAKGMTLATLGFCVINILWLEIAPTAATTIGWKYYLVFICLSIFGAATIYFTFPNTLGKPLEEIARVFGDEDLVAVYQQDIHVDHDRHEVIEKGQLESEVVQVERVDQESDRS